MIKYTWPLAGIITFVVVLVLLIHFDRPAPIPVEASSIDYDAMAKIMPQDISGPISPGTPAPDFQMTMLDNTIFQSKAMTGHAYIVDFWATWCGPCRMSIPGLEQLSKDYAAKGVRVVGVSVDTDTASQVPAFVQQNNITYSVGVDSSNVASIAGAFNVNSFPSLFVIDKHGVVCWSVSGYYPGEEGDLHKLLDKVDAES